MRDYLDSPGVHAFYLKPGMGKTTIAKAMLRDEFYNSGQPSAAAFVTRSMTGRLEADLASVLRTTPEQAFADMDKALLALRGKGIKRLMLVIDAMDEVEMDRADIGVVWQLKHLYDDMFMAGTHMHVVVLCMVRSVDTRNLFEEMNGGVKITGGPGVHRVRGRCPKLDKPTIDEYARRLGVRASDHEQWTTRAPYLVVVNLIANGREDLASSVAGLLRHCEEDLDESGPGKRFVQLEIKFNGTWAWLMVNPATDSATLEEAIRNKVGLPAEARFYLKDALGYGVPVDGNIAEGSYTLVRVGG